MRTDQYIGLTKRAQDFVSTLTRMPSYSIEGAWNSIDLGVWIDERHSLIYIERVQMSPWSSGPMYFTHLQVLKSNGDDYSEHVLSWIVDPTMSKEEYGDGRMNA